MSLITADLMTKSILAKVVSCFILIKRTHQKLWRSGVIHRLVPNISKKN